MKYINSKVLTSKNFILICKVDNGKINMLLLTAEKECCLRPVKRDKDLENFKRVLNRVAKNYHRNRDKNIFIN
jgi:hypothetical protein